MFRYAASKYLLIWIKDDREIIAKFQGSVDQERLTQLLNKYKVKRNFPKKGDGLNNFVNFINEKRSCCNELDAIKDVIEFTNRLQSPENTTRGGRPLSAVSKVFWMLYGHPVIIYDSLTRKGLRALNFRVPEMNYEVYCRSWKKVYDDNRQQIDDAYIWLHKSEFVNELIERKIISQVDVTDLYSSDNNQQRIKNRIVDQYLVTMGELNGDKNGKVYA